jgi:hypothetical protein
MAASPAYVMRFDPGTGRKHGDPALFEAQGNGISAHWESARTNSFFYFPLGLTLTREDAFSFEFDINLAEIAIGTTPDKPYTFEIAAGLINTTNAFDPELFRGSGVNTEHGARNLIEWTYFPDSGFGATVSPTVATAANQIAFSDNHPVELTPGVNYHFEISFSPEDQVLRSTMRSGTHAPEELKRLALSPAFSGFQLNAFAVASYSDAGQSPPQFSGSVEAVGTVSNASVSIYSRPILSIEAATIAFETKTNYVYYLESSPDLHSWQSTTKIVNGTGAAVRMALDPDRGGVEFYRVRAEKSP